MLMRKNVQNWPPHSVKRRREARGEEGMTIIMVSRSTASHLLCANLTTSMIFQCQRSSGYISRVPTVCLVACMMIQTYISNSNEIKQDLSKPQLKNWRLSTMRFICLTRSFAGCSCLKNSTAFMYIWVLCSTSNLRARRNRKRTLSFSSCALKLTRRERNQFFYTNVKYILTSTLSTH